MPRGLVFVVAIAAITLALIVANALWRPPPIDTVKPRSASPSEVISVTPSASASPARSATSSATPVAPLLGYEIAQWNFRIDLPEGWRRSFALSTVNANTAADAGIEVFTRRPVSDETQLGASPNSAAWNGVVYVRMWRVTGMSSLDLANGVAGGASAARRGPDIDGRASVQRDFVDGTTRTFVMDGSLGYEVAYRTGDPRPSGADDAALRTIDATFHFLAPASRAGTGTIAGPLGYPSDFIPAEHVCAIRADQPSTQRCVDTPSSREQVWYRIPDIAPGTYWIVAYVAPLGPTGNELAGGYTTYVMCGMTASCPRDHTLVNVAVAADAYLSGLPPTDFYAPPDAYPPRSR